jgi:hypothetical protein
VIPPMKDGGQKPPPDSCAGLDLFFCYVGTPLQKSQYSPDIKIDDDDDVGGQAS